jgi:MFS family permease
LRWTAVTAICAGLLYAAGGGGTGAAPLLVATAVLGIALFAPRLLPQGTLLGRAGLPAVVALRGLAAAAFFCGEVLLPLLLVQERGLSATQSGLVLTAGALGWSAGSWFQGRCRLEGQARVRRLQRGMAAIGGGGLLVALVAWPAVPVGVALVGWTIAGGGIGLVYPTLSVLTLECAPPGQHGQASSALQLSDSLFSAVALAVASMLPAVVFADVAGAPQVAGFGLAAALALTGVAVAARTRPTASVG